MQHALLQVEKQRDRILMLRIGGTWKANLSSSTPLKIPRDSLALFQKKLVRNFKIFKSLYALNEVAATLQDLKSDTNAVQFEILVCLISAK